MRLSHLKASKYIFSGKYNSQKCLSICGKRNYANDKYSHPEFINSTILVEDGLNVRELPVIVRKIRYLTDEPKSSEPVSEPTDSNNYHLIQAEFSQCTDLKDVFTLLSKCIKITPSIALGAMERIFDLEKKSNLPMLVDSRLMNVHAAKDAIIEKLLKVVMQTEDTQTILNALNAESLVLEPYKYKFCDELLIRVIDNKLTLQQLSDFILFLGTNKIDEKYAETIDKLWVGFLDKQDEINEKNIVALFRTITDFKASKTTVMLLLEKKLWSFWWKIGIEDMQEILNTFIKEPNLSKQSLGVVGRWLNTNIHALTEDSLLDIITKLSRLKYTDIQVEAAIERFVKLKGEKIYSQILIVGILNYCMTFRIRNVHILNGCSKYFVSEAKSISHSFLKSFIYPFGYLYYDPVNSEKFWQTVENSLIETCSKINTDDLLSVLISSLYIGRQPLKFVNIIFGSQFIANIKKSNDSDKLLQKLKIIDTSLALECKTYSGPFLPKTESSKSPFQDTRIKKIVQEIKKIVPSVMNNSKLSTAVTIPHLYSDEMYLIDIMIHPDSVNISDVTWVSKSETNEIIGILIQLPEHYCWNSTKLVGSQMMRKRHLRLLGFKVVSLNYIILCKLSHQKSNLEKYIKNCLDSQLSL